MIAWRDMSIPRFATIGMWSGALVKPIDGLMHVEAGLVKEPMHATSAHAEKRTGLTGHEFKSTIQYRHRSLSRRKRLSNRLNLLKDASARKMLVRRRIVPQFRNLPQASTYIERANGIAFFVGIITKGGASLTLCDSSGLVNKVGADTAGQRCSSSDRFNHARRGGQVPLGDLCSYRTRSKGSSGKSDHNGKSAPAHTVKVVSVALYQRWEDGRVIGRSSSHGPAGMCFDRFGKHPFLNPAASTRIGRSGSLSLGSEVKRYS